MRSSLPSREKKRAAASLSWPTLGSRPSRGVLTPLETKCSPISTSADARCANALSIGTFGPAPPSVSPLSGGGGNSGLAPLTTQPSLLKALNSPFLSPSLLPAPPPALGPSSPPSLPPSLSPFPVLPRAISPSTVRKRPTLRSLDDANGLRAQ
eukprot:6209173-Pleurochrysis_carterae.AAC.1